MNDKRYDEEAIFKVACQIASPAARAVYLSQVCGDPPAVLERVTALLRVHDEESRFLESPPPGLANSPTLDQPLLERPGAQIGPYKLLQQIGEGGFGVVFMAEQLEPMRRKVALKVIKPGMDTRQVIARFEAERQALAVMEHPNIARVLDAGATQSCRPYFVMELVRGVPITAYCDENNLSVRERLTLFTSVCQAIQHAHTKGIIHRDIKPTNVLVTRQDGQPMAKVIDFGVAKATGQQLTDKTLFTEFAQMIGTPLYMSPEQAELSSTDIDTRSDIYSLGVLLYELLTGSTPVSKEQFKQAAFDEIRRIIREDEPQKPSTRISTAEAAPNIAAQRHTEPAKLTALVRGELDWIVMKALEKDRRRRYETANALARDIERHLHDEPVQACPPSTWYRFRKFVRRNKGPVLVTALIVVALVGGIIGTTLGMLRATVAEADAVAQAEQKEEQRAKAVTEGERATRAERDARQRLLYAKMAEAKASRRSREAGQRFDTWNAVTEAADLARELKMDDQVFLTLRNEAIACLALTDVQFVKEWPGWPPGSLGSLGFDENLERYARSDAKGNISVRSISNDQQLALLAAPGRFGPGRGGDAILFRPQGDLIAVRYHDPIPGQSTNLLIWDWKREKAVFQPKFNVSWFALSFSPDGRYLALGKPDGGVALHEVGNWQETHRFSGRRDPQHLAFSPDSARLAVCADGEVQVWEVSGKKLLHTLPHPSKVNRLAWHPCGERLVAGCDDSDIYLWDTATVPQRVILRGHQAGGIVPLFSPSGDTLVTRSYDGTSRFWNPWSGHQLLCVATVPEHFDRDGSLLASQMGGNLFLWKMAESREVRTLPRNENFGTEAIDHGGFSPNGRWLAAGTTNGIRIWDMAIQKEAAFLPISPHMKDVKFHPNGQRLFSGGISGLYEWPVQVYEGVLRMGPAHKVPGIGSVEQLSLDGTGRILVVVGASSAWILDLEKSADNVRQVGHANATFVSTSPDGRWMATGTFNGFGVKIWETRTGSLLVDLHQEARIGTVTFSPDPSGRWLVTGADNIFTIWATPQGDQPANDLASWQPRQVPNNYGSGVFSSDGNILAVNASPAVVRLLDPATALTIAEFEGADIDLNSPFSFSPDNTQLVVATKAGTIRVWDLRLLREQLKKIGLDWDLPEYPSSRSSSGDVKPMKIEVDFGDLNTEFVAQKDLAAELWDQNKPVEAIAGFRKAVELNPGSAEVNNALAWALATCVDDGLRDPNEAVKTAAKAVGLAPQEGYYWNTLGVARYRAGEWNGGIEALKKSDELLKGEMFSFNAFFLAMAHFRLGEEQKSREWYERAVQWMNTNQPDNVELRRFRTEAAELLGVEEKKD